MEICCWVFFIFKVQFDSSCQFPLQIGFTSDWLHFLFRPRLILLQRTLSLFSHIIPLFYLFPLLFIPFYISFLFYLFSFLLFLFLPIPSLFPFFSCTICFLFKQQSFSVPTRFPIHCPLSPLSIARQLSIDVDFDCLGRIYLTLLPKQVSSRFTLQVLSCFTSQENSI